MQKLKIGVVFGGKSGEHEVSLVSAGSVIDAIDRDKYEVVEIGITKEGKWYGGDGCLDAFKKEDFGTLTPLSLNFDPEEPGVLLGDKLEKIDVFFPVLHGPFGEDGTIQGLFEMMGAAYVGCGVLASSTAMDKIQCKAIWEAAGLPVVEDVVFNRRDKEAGKKAVMEKLGLPCFVKPANMGSSVGVSKAKDEEGLDSAIELACKYDSKILVEKALNVREIECAVLGNHEVVASPVGEVIVGGEFYDFHDKYVNGVSSTEIPANLEDGMANQIREICLKAYKVLDCSGLARVDCFVDKDSGKIYLNEINTMPGFTSISMYPKMMAEHGMEYSELVDKLIQLGLERFEERSNNQVVFDSGSDWFRG